MSEFRRLVSRVAGLPAPAPRVRRPVGERPGRLKDRSEADLCDVIGEWLKAGGAEVFFEVPIGDGRPDVVAFKGERTIAVEAKLRDIRGVVKQGLRAAARVDAAYIALPVEAASEAAFELRAMIARYTDRGAKPPVVPGVMAVGRGVTVLMDPEGRPRRRVDQAAIRADALRYGQERGGVPSTEKTERDIELYLARVDGAGWVELGERFDLSPSGGRNAVRRLSVWMDHLHGGCDGSPCGGGDEERRDFFAAAHRSSARIGVLPPLR
jgi:hypothetical protein